MTLITEPTYLLLIHSSTLISNLRSLALKCIQTCCEATGTRTWDGDGDGKVSPVQGDDSIVLFISKAFNASGDFDVSLAIILVLLYTKKK